MLTEDQTSVIMDFDSCQEGASPLALQWGRNGCSRVSYEVAERENDFFSLSIIEKRWSTSSIDSMEFVSERILDSGF